MSGTSRAPIGPDVTKRPVLASYDDYLAAQKAVDTLSDNGFPVQNVAIVGVDVRIVESVLGRMSWGKAAASGLFSGAWFGGLIGLFIALFGTTNGEVLPLLALGLAYGAAAGIVFGMVSYAFTGGKRDFVSRQQLQAARYDVLCEQQVMGEARRILGLSAAWPPPLPGDEPAASDEA
ncbi:MAG: general stress protein [Candidatus Nanopelagicales bacterium]